MPTGNIVVAIAFGRICDRAIGIRALAGRHFQTHIAGTPPRLDRLPMYQRHFGFSRPLFADGVAQDEFVYRTATAARAARDLTAALGRSDAVAILAGPSGTGKTTLATDALKTVGTRLAFTCISQPPLTSQELLEQLLTDFGFEPWGKSRAEQLQLWRQFLSEMTATDSRVCVLVENAEAFNPEVMLALHSLTAADAALSRGANVILTTAQPPETLLAAAEMLAFNQRVCLRRRIGALTDAEVLEYLRFKLSLGGSDPDEILDSGFAGLLEEYSGGIIRVIDNLLEAALRQAAAAGLHRLTADVIIEVAEQSFGLTRLAPAAVDSLLATTGQRQQPAAIDPDDIPTLTEFVRPLRVRREQGPDLRRAARR